ncbi:MAG: hypothetical protein WDA71_08735 [Actinomycetota bacterium]
MRKRICMRAVGVALLAIVGMAGLASAQTSTPYPPQEGQATVSGTAGIAGSKVTVSGEGFCPNSTVTIRLVALTGGTITTLGTATADSSGRASKEVTIPTDIKAGSYTIELVGTGSNCSAARVLGARYTVTAKVLVKTGRNFAPWIAAAAGALLLGVVLIVVARASKRRGAAAAQ